MYVIQTFMYAHVRVPIAAAIRTRAYTYIDVWILITEALLLWNIRSYESWVIHKNLYIYVTADFIW